MPRSNPQAESNIFEHCKVSKQSIVLKGEADLPQARRLLSYLLAFKKDLALITLALKTFVEWKYQAAQVEEF